MTKTNPLFLQVKRAFDIIFSVLMLLLFSPIILILALLVRLDLGYPILFKQPRLGLNGKPFILYKFRTMIAEVGPGGDLLSDGKRITRLGGFLRDTSLDELPELWNVLRGDMSVVGPRPLLVEYRDLYSREQWRRHEMRPGMAGPVLASGRNALSWEDKFRQDVYYVDHWSLGLDISILWKTILAVLKREGTRAAGHATMPRFEGSEEGNNK